MQSPVPHHSVIRAEALSYARLGMPVIPLLDHPIFKGWPELATTDPRIITAAVRVNTHKAPGDVDMRWPRGERLQAIGLVTGHPDNFDGVDMAGPAREAETRRVFFDVIDIDVKNTGRFSREAELILQALPPRTPLARTQSGGLHAYVAATGYANAVGFLPEVDYRGRHGYAKAAPSHGYVWLERPKGWFPPAPAIVTDALKAIAMDKERWRDAVDPNLVPARPGVSHSADWTGTRFGKRNFDVALADLTQARSGHRHDVLIRSASKGFALVHGGEMPGRLVYAALEKAAQALDTDRNNPFSTDEIHQTLQSANEWGRANPRSMPVRERYEAAPSASRSTRSPGISLELRGPHTGPF